MTEFLRPRQGGNLTGFTGKAVAGFDKMTDRALGFLVQRLPFVGQATALTHHQDNGIGFQFG
jgi:hypothetical protein